MLTEDLRQRKTAGKTAWNSPFKKPEVPALKI